ncbi:hypothetical protein ACJRO7_030124 [Eucalyptus globulus]|uniref:Uncharacterized protein n=1 Tax=Eucalyptus globulus TaxID=34317 RepID=A0ABD3JD14_EUCGL
MDTEMRADERDEFVDWKGRKAKSEEHGGIRPASLTCVVEVLENMVFLSNATNFVAYFIGTMHYPTAVAANMVTNFMGTSFLLTIFAGFISDSFLTRFTTFVVSCAVELLGLIILTIQAHSKSLQPPIHRTPSKSQAAVLYFGLYAMATGVGGIKASLPTHGADQLDHRNQRLISTFFNWFFFSLCTGGLVSATVMVWVEENLGWRWSFKISVVALFLALAIFVSGLRLYRYKLPQGSAFARIFKVLASAARNRKASLAEEDRRIGVNSEVNNTLAANGRHPEKFRFLDKALADGTVSASEVEETRAFIGLIPIFASTILMNCCLAQLQTFSVEQGAMMDRRIRNFQIPTQSLTVLPLIIMLASIPIYERFRSTVGDKPRTRSGRIFEPLPRIGLGLALASGSMAIAAAVEVKRRRAAADGAVLSVFWLSWQYLLLGVSDMFTLGGMLEFFYSRAPGRMRSVCTALAWCSTSMGFFLSSALVSAINSATGRYGREWLGGSDLNRARLDLYYAVLCVLSFLNFLNYIFWAKRY